MCQIPCLIFNAVKFAVKNKSPIRLSRNGLFNAINKWRITDVCAVFRWIQLIFYDLFYGELLQPCGHLRLTYAHEIRAYFFFFAARVGRSVSLYFTFCNEVCSALLHWLNIRFFYGLQI